MERKVNISGRTYNVIETKDINVGDLVLDTKDHTYCMVTIRNPNEDHVTVTEGGVPEAGIPIERLRKLVLIDNLNKQ
jgi:hypothetical protein